MFCDDVTCCRCYFISGSFKFHAHPVCVLTAVSRGQAPAARTCHCGSGSMNRSIQVVDKTRSSTLKALNYVCINHGGQRSSTLKALNYVCINHGGQRSSTLKALNYVCINHGGQRSSTLKALNYVCINHGGQKSFFYLKPS